MPVIGLPVKSIGCKWWPFERVLCELGSESQHQPVGDDAAAHVPVEHEGETAEHLALAQRGVGGKDVPHAYRELLVVATLSTLGPTVDAVAGWEAQAA